MFNVIELSDAAVSRVKEIMLDAGPQSKGIRVGIKNGGCAGMEYVVDLVTSEDPKDDKVERDGITVYVDPAASLFLLGTKMDYRQEVLRSGFVFDNPNQTSECGCGESVTLVAAKPEEHLNG